MNKDRLPKQHPEGILFTFEGDSNTQSVAVAGTFNHWDKAHGELKPIGNNLWQTILPISAGRHLYKYVVNGRQWILDPANPWVSEDAQNNSCFTLTDIGELFIRQGDISASSPSSLYRRHHALPSPDWVRDGVIYELSVRAFGGNFGGLERKLDYLSSLGITILWLMPIHPIGVQKRLKTLGDPYATYDFEAIDPALGTPDEFKRLITAIHKRGMRVIMDIPLNRSSCDGVLVQKHPDWFTHTPSGDIYYAVPNRAYFAGFDFSNTALRAYLMEMLSQWVRRFEIDGFRFDDSDLVPLDFLNQTRAQLATIRPDIGLISQAYDELHHLAACDLTYDGGVREMVYQVMMGKATVQDFQAAWIASTYSFPCGALRMRWLEEKEQGRAYRYYGREGHLAAATVLLTLDGVPMLMMGQEFNDSHWITWQSLFEEFRLDWQHFDTPTFYHYQILIRLRHTHPALRLGAVQFLPSTRGILRYARHYANEYMIVTVNLTPQAQPFPYESAEYEVLYRFNPDGSLKVDQIGAFGCVIRVRI